MNPEVIKGIAVALLLLGAFVGVGAVLYGTRSLAPRDALRKLPVLCALGTAAFSFLGYLFAMMAPVSWQVIVLLSVAGIAAGWSYWKLLLAAISSFDLAILRHKDTLFKLILFGGLSLVLLALVSMNWFTPPKEGDALTGYMFTARWLYNHGLVYNPYNPRYSLFPLNTEMIYSFSFAFGTDLVAKALDGFLGLIFLAAIYEFANRYTTKTYSFFAAASLAITREFITNWSNGKVDIVACFICFAGVSLLFAASTSRDLRLLVLGSFLIGTACSEKYTYWIICLTAPLWAYLLFKDGGKREGLKAALINGITIAACLVPHFLKNIAWTGNPFAPFAANIVPSHNIYLGHLSDADPSTLRDFVIFPYKLFFGPDYLSNPGPLPFLILLGVPLYLFASRKSSRVTLILILATLQIAVWIGARQSQWFVPRFILLPVSLMLIVAGVGLQRFSEKSRIVNWGAVAVLTTLMMIGIFGARHYRASLPFVLGKEDRLSWQRRLVPHRGYGVLHDLNDRMAPDARMMIATSLYNLPENKLDCISTEKEFKDFDSVPDDGKVQYFQEHGFKFLYRTSTTQPAWLERLHIVEQVPGVTVYELETSKVAANGGVNTP